jgi:hypothetical protein
MARRCACAVIAAAWRSWRTLRRGLEQALLVQQVIQIGEFARGHGAGGDLAADAVHPGHDPGIEITTATHGVIHPSATLDQARKNVVDIIKRESIVGAEALAGSLCPHALAVPELLQRILFMAEQHVLTVRRPGTNTATASGSGKPVR